MRWPDKQTLDKAHSAASIFSLVGIPLVVLLVGSWIQSSLSEQSVKKDYVQIAISILSDPKTATEVDLRNWATEVLSKNSPVPFTPSLKEKFVAGKTLHDFAWLSPTRTLKIPADLMQPPKDPIEPASEHVQENSEIASLNTAKFKALQEWLRNNTGWAGVAMNLGLEDNKDVPR